jgi:transposase
VFFAGVDAHSRYVVVTVIDRMGQRVLAPTRVPNREAATRLLVLLAPYRPLDAVVETSSAWPWLHEVLSAAGIRFVLAHARRLRAIAEANYKRDDIDADLLARMRRAGLIPAVYCSSAEQREWATLLRHRVVLVQQRTAAANRIHAQLHLCGLAVARGHLLTRGGREWLRTTARARLSVEQWALVRSQLQLIRGLTRFIRAIERRIATVAAAIPAAALLQTIPGIGPQRALLLCAEALPIRRFPTPGHLASYAGLVPRSSPSGERGVRHGPIPAGANRWLRGALVRAVVSHVRAAPERWLSQYYVAQKPRIGWPVARVAAARKLTRAIHAMLRTTTPWQSSLPTHPTPTDPAIDRRKDATAPRGELVTGHAALTA